jgi:TetR/AcrR family transcriptional repressor of nem operon
MGRVSDARARLIQAVGELIWTGSYGSTTIDQICAKAGVRKGSFYHFFKSKTEVAKLAIEAEWEQERAEWDRMFSASVPPLDRLRRLARRTYEEQVELKREHGRVLGCPLCQLGAEVSTLEDDLRAVVERIMNQARRYFESAVRDAAAEGLIPAKDLAAKARMLHTYGEGLLTMARIHNNLELLRDMERGLMDILGVKEATAHGR